MDGLGVGGFVLRLMHLLATDLWATDPAGSLPKRRQPGEAPSTHKIVRIDKKDAMVVIDNLFNSRLISIVNGAIHLEAKERKQLCRKPSVWKNGLG